MGSNLTNSISGFPGGFTVLMAIYAKNDPQLFVKSVKSIYENHLKPDSMILAIDGPVPKDLEFQIEYVVKQYGVTVVRLEKNEGHAIALNLGIANSGTDWIVRADGDDYNLPQRFECLAKLVREQPELDLIGSAILEFEYDGTPVACRVLPVTHQQIGEFIKRRNPFNHMAVAYKKSMVERCGGYPILYFRDDYALWVKMFTSGAKCANLHEVLVYANAGREMYSRRGGWRHALHGEYNLQKLMVQYSVKSWFRGLCDGLLRSSVFVSPNWLRRFVYEHFLRDSAENVSEINVKLVSYWLGKC